MSLNLSENVSAFLKARPNQKFSLRQITDWLMETFPDECADKIARSAVLETSKDLQQQLAAEIHRSRPKIQAREPAIKTVKSGMGNTILFYYSTLSDEAELKQVVKQGLAQGSEPDAPRLREADMYPKLAEYLRTECQVEACRINEKRSSNRRGPRGNHWLYPDMVGREDLRQGWAPLIKAAARELGAHQLRLYSFEVKLLINRANVREHYFQAVSNSSWANFAYLVTAELAEDEALPELMMLAGVHGIGVILLNTDNPSDSQLLIPARERPEVDWESANRLAQQNADFMEFVRGTINHLRAIE